MTAPQTPTPGIPLSAEEWASLADLHTLKGWLHGVSLTPDWNDVVADGGITVAMVTQQEAREMAERVGRVIDNFRLTTPSDQGEAKPLDAEARAEAWADQAEVQAMVDALSEVFRKWAPQPILSRFREQMMAVLQQAFIEGTMRPTAPASGSDGLETVGEAGTMAGSNGGFTMAAFKASAVPVGTALVTREQFIERFVARMLQADPGDEAYAREAAATYWEDKDQRSEGPEACAEADISYWGEG